MITYVNTVLVSNVSSSNLLTSFPSAVANGAVSTDAGKFIVVTCDKESKYVADPTDATDVDLFPIVTKDTAGLYDTIKIGIVTKKNATKVNYKTGAVSYEPIIKWSNIIKAADIKNIASTTWAPTANSEDTAVINFRSLDSSLLNKLNDGGKRIIVRLTFKDLPTRFRKWTESYEYVTVEGDTVATIVAGIISTINKQYKRARIIASYGTAVAGSSASDPDVVTPTSSGSEASSNAVILTAMPYDDDNAVDTINWANKVRFNVNIYYTDPAADGWESKNKHFPKGVEVTKTPGKQYTASGKLVRDREAQAMGYEGILNRGEGTWPVIKPAMETEYTSDYDALTVEFENMYRAADDIFRKTKQTVEMYCKHTPATGGAAEVNSLAGIDELVKAFATGSFAEDDNDASNSSNSNSDVQV